MIQASTAYKIGIEGASLSKPIEEETDAFVYCSQLL
jgi:hypothetical protein